MQLRLIDYVHVSADVYVAISACTCIRVFTGRRTPAQRCSLALYFFLAVMHMQLVLVRIEALTFNSALIYSNLMPPPRPLTSIMEVENISPATTYVIIFEDGFILRTRLRCRFVRSGLLLR